MKTILLAIILITLPVSALAALPNILIIAIDDMNDWVEGFGGHPDTITPNISDLASRGVRFTNAHASSDACNPSRTSLLFGLAPRNTGVLRNTQRPMRDYVGNYAETVFQYFSKHGYFIAGTGKLFHTNDQTEPWDEYPAYTWNRGQPLINPYHGLDELNGSFLWGPGEGDDSEWGDYQIAQYGESFLMDNHESPFILALGFTLPHLQWYAPHKNWDRFPEEPVLPPNLANDRDDLPPEALNYKTEYHQIITDGNKWHEGVRAYLASINFTDENVGRVIAALDNSDYSGNTIIVLWSDHGFHLGEKNKWSKYSLWEETTRVPLIIVAPDVTPANSESDAVVSLLDLYPTLVELAGLPTKEGLDGVSLMNLLIDPVNGSRTIDYAVTSSAKGDTLRNQRWRYIKYNNGGEELYDHDNDPNEHVNLATLPEYSDIKLQLETQLVNAISFPPDSDKDGHSDLIDNCTEIGNVEQRDTDNDGFGNLCDADFNNNGIVDPGDFSLMKARFGQAGFPDQDLNGNGVVDPADFSLLKAGFGKPPGPSGSGP